MFVKDFGLRVHGAVWAALHTEETSTVEKILATIAEVQSERLQDGFKDVQVFLTGHSLGGAYALVTALEMISRKIVGVDTLVLTFGTISPKQELTC